MRWTRVRWKTNGAGRTVKSCGPDISTLISSLQMMTLQTTVTKKPDHRGEREGNR
jgi:hypothetical protein